MDFPIDDSPNNQHNSNEDEIARIDTRKLKPLNDPNCEHDLFLDEEDPALPGVEIWKCRKCPVGFPMQR